MSPETDQDWRAICEQVLRETDRDRIDVLLEELLEALEVRAQARETRSASDS